jgi:hypothetical protein
LSLYLFHVSFFKLLVGFGGIASSSEESKSLLIRDLYVGCALGRCAAELDEACRVVSAGLFSVGFGAGIDLAVNRPSGFRTGFKGAAAVIEGLG